jgi:hypothetical protein
MRRYKVRKSFARRNTSLKTFSIENISPQIISINTETYISVVGTNFEDPKISFDDITYFDPSNYSLNSIVFKTSSYSSLGNKQVFIKTKTSKFEFNLSVVNNLVPKINSITAASFYPGFIIIAVGENFSAASSFFLDGYPVNFNYINPASISFIAPEEGLHTINNLEFEVSSFSDFSIEDVNPKSFITSGGNALVSGKGFTSKMLVSVDSVPLNSNALSQITPTSFVVTFPSRTTEGNFSFRLSKDDGLNYISSLGTPFLTWTFPVLVPTPVISEISSWPGQIGVIRLTNSSSVNILRISDTVPPTALEISSWPGQTAYIRLSSSADIENANIN